MINSCQKVQLNFTQRFVDCGRGILLIALRSFLCLYPYIWHDKMPKLPRGNRLREALSPLDVTSDEMLSFPPLFCPFSADLPHVFLLELLISCGDFSQLPERKRRAFAALQVKGQYKKLQSHILHVPMIKQNSCLVFFNQFLLFKRDS